MAQTAIKLIDTHRKVVYKFTGTNDSGGRILKIDTGSLFGALNANSQLLGAGSDRIPTYRTYLKSLYYDIGGGTSGAASPGSFIEITNDSTVASNTILVLSPNSNKWPFNEGGEPLVIDMANGNGGTANGNIFFNIQLTGTQNSYTIIMDLRKEPTHYDQGQFTDPMAFNRSPRGVNG